MNERINHFKQYSQSENLSLLLIQRLGSLILQSEPVEARIVRAPRGVERPLVVALGIHMFYLKIYILNY